MTHKEHGDRIFAVNVCRLPRTAAVWLLTLLCWVSSSLPADGGLQDAIGSEGLVSSCTGEPGIRPSRQKEGELRVEQKGEFSGENIKRFGIESFDLEKGYSYSLAIHINASFISPTFNTIPYLRSVSELQLIDPLDKDFECSIKTSFNKSSVNWTVLLKFAKRPDPSLPLTFASGPYGWALKLGAMKWKQYQSESSTWDPETKKYRPKRWTWWGAQGSVDVPLKDPDWVILKFARFVQHGDSKTSLLDVFFENSSQAATRVNQLSLTASHNWGILCAIGGRPNPWQAKEYSWHLTVSKALIGAKEVGTPLKDEEVQIQGEFRHASCGKYEHGIRASVPLQIDLEPNAVTRILLKVAKISMDPRGFKFGPPPDLLSEWDRVSVLLDPNYPIYPHRIKVQ